MNHLIIKLRAVLIIIITVLVLLAIVEGGASLLLFGYQFTKNILSLRADRHHTKYDPALGWINIPGFNVQDMYGKGRSVTINSHGLRSQKEITTLPPPGKTRLVCTGDSFTFGFGVSDADTWCHLLETYQPGFEFINMGQDGYGVDQAFLWYKRDGVSLHANTHIFAFTGLDLDRMLVDEFYGYGKPTLSVRNGILTVKNTPVPRSLLQRFDWLRANRDTINSLRLAILANKALPSRRINSLSDSDGKEELVSSIFTELEKLNSSVSCRTVFVYLPTMMDLEGGYDDLRKGLSTISRDNNWIFIDLTDEFKQASKSNVDLLFISENDKTQFLAAAGHYSKDGHLLVSKLLFRRLKQLSLL